MATDVAADVIAALGLLITSGSLIVAARANKAAKNAGRVAKVANDIAADGIVKAEEANRIAVEGAGRHHRPRHLLVAPQGPGRRCHRRPPL